MNPNSRAARHQNINITLSLFELAMIAKAVSKDTCIIQSSASKLALSIMLNELVKKYVAELPDISDEFVMDASGKYPATKQENRK